MNGNITCSLKRLLTQFMGGVTQKTLMFIALLCFVVTTSFSDIITTPKLYIYVSDAGNFSKGPWKIVRYDEDGNNPVDFITTGLSWPQDIIFLEEKNEVLISNLNTGEINRHHSETVELLGLFAKAEGPTRMKIGPDNLLYI